MYANNRIMSCYKLADLNELYKHIYTIKMISNTSRYAYINTIAGMISYFPRRQFIQRYFLN